MATALPCPFCGEQPTFESAWMGEDKFANSMGEAHFLMCEGCELCFGHEITSDKPAIAAHLVEKWNIRTSKQTSK